MVAEEKFKVLPSKLHSHVYCPRITVFETIFKPSLKQRIRMILGRIYHVFFEILKLRGYRREELLEIELGGNIVLRGRPDGYLEKEDEISVVEVKSYRAPKWGDAWDSDKAQILAYGLILHKLKGKNIVLKIRYIDREVEVPFNTENVSWLFEVICQH